MDLFSIFQILLVLGVILLLILISIVYMTSKPPNLQQYESEKFFKDPSKGNKACRFGSIYDSPSVDLSVIVPSYNEAERFKETASLDEMLEHLEERKKKNSKETYELIIVDDGSKDKTSEVALEYSKKYGCDKVRVLTLEKNRGKGGAIRMGIFSCRGRKCLFADADGATKFSDLTKLEVAMDKLEKSKDNLAIACGSRAHLEQDSIAERSFFRTILMKGFHFLVWFLCVRGVNDTQCGFKLFTREAAELLFGIMHVERWAFDVDLLHIAQHYKIPVAEVAVNWQEIEGSTLDPLWASLQMGRDLVLIRLRYMIGGWSMKPRPKVE